MYFVKNIPDSKLTTVYADQAYDQLPAIAVAGERGAFYVADLEDNAPVTCHPSRACGCYWCSIFAELWNRPKILGTPSHKMLTYFNITMLSDKLNNTGKCKMQELNINLPASCKNCGSYTFGTLAKDLDKLNGNVSCPCCQNNWTIGNCYDCEKPIEKGESHIDLMVDVRKGYGRESARVHSSCLKNKQGMKCLNTKCDNWLYYSERTLPWVCLDHRQNPVQGHEYKPNRWLPIGKSDLFGIEIEVMPASGSGFNASSRNYYAAVASNLSDHVYVKHDGSVDLGFEVVTHPINYSAWQGSGDDIAKVKRVFSFLTRKYTSFSDPACGLHVHLNIGDFESVDHIQTFASFIMYQPYFCSVIGERTSRSYSKFSRAVADETKKRTAGGKVDRYTAVNVQPGAPTVEVRMFKGNLKWDRILKNIEFCRALREWTKEQALPFVKTTSAPNAFINWAEEQKYMNLTKFIAAQPKLVRSFI